MLGGAGGDTPPRPPLSLRAEVNSALRCYGPIDTRGRGPKHPSTVPEARADDNRGAPAHLGKREGSSVAIRVLS